jgi:GTP cyclohydrolase I
MEDLIRQILKHIGDDPEREGLKDTPKRVVKAWLELYAGYKQDPAEILSTVFEEGSCDEMVILKDIEFVSTCEHHMEKILGTVDIGYVPDKRVVGLSKLARLVDCFARRLQIQEKFTTDIASAITEHLKPKGVAVVVKASHQCMSCRGVKKSGATMITSSMTGIFREDPKARSEFIDLCKA